MWSSLTRQACVHETGEEEEKEEEVLEESGVCGEVDGEMEDAV